MFKKKKRRKKEDRGLHPLTFILMLDRVPDVSKLAIFKDQEVVLLSQIL